MTVRREIAESRWETGARSREDPRRTRAVRRGAHGAMNTERHVCARRRVGEAAGPEGRARRPKARRSSESAIAAEVLMNNAGYHIFGSQ